MKRRRPPPPPPGPVSYGTRALFIAWPEEGNRQYTGILRLLRELAEQPASRLLRWNGSAPDLHRRRALRRVVVCGHGNEQSAGLSGRGAGRLKPELLRLPAGCSLYLVGCYQGSAALRPLWAAGTGLPAERIFGSEGETESALSTSLLLHLLEEGIRSLDRWFPEWVRCNRALRPHFPLIRRLYAEHGADPLSTLTALRTVRGEAGREAGGASLAALLRRYETFLSVVDRHPEYLSGLAGPPPPSTPQRSS